MVNVRAIQQYQNSAHTSCPTPLYPQSVDFVIFLATQGGLKLTNQRAAFGSLAVGLRLTNQRAAFRGESVLYKRKRALQLS